MSIVKNILWRILRGIQFMLYFILSTILMPLIMITLRFVSNVINYLVPGFNIFSRLKLDWALNARIFIYYILNTKVVSIPRNKYPFGIPKSVPLIESGFIGCNHRSWFDFAFDPLMANAAIVGRKEAFMAVTGFSILGFLDRRLVSFNRHNCTRHQVFSKMLQSIEVPSVKTHILRICFNARLRRSENNATTPWRRIVFYPEGTRKSYTTLTRADVDKHIKKGILLSIYQHQLLPVQFVITSNKDKIVNEKKLTAQRGVVAKTINSNPIYPSKYDTFDAFLEAIYDEWYTCWKLTHE